MGILTDPTQWFGASDGDTPQPAQYQLLAADQRWYFIPGLIGTVGWRGGIVRFPGISTDGAGAAAGAFSNLPITPGSVSIVIGAETITDNGFGVLTGDVGAVGTINYADGPFSITGAELFTVMDNTYNFVPSPPATELPSTMIFTWEVVEVNSGGDDFIFSYQIDNGAIVEVVLGNVALSTGQIELEIPNGTTQFHWGVRTNGSAPGVIYYGTLAIGEIDCDTSFNCECEVDPESRTLAAMRLELLARAGYAAQANNPPPGIANLFNSYLRGAQEYLYRQYKAMQTERFFSWRLEQGVRYYGLWDNIQCCEVKLDRYKITGAWLEDPNGVWVPLVYGIPPEFYTMTTFIGWPARYEVRQCIEVFPAPQADGYKLWVKGHFGLYPFAADADLTTINAEPVFLWALALAKSQKGDKDAGVPTLGRETGYYGMAVAIIKNLIANSHVNRRYVPRGQPVPAPTPPIMVQFDS